ncbi:MAG: GtrA family protein [Candidatus Pacebacteria bacterium]|nr:GtrA family protein [Candidatus Paceibacterota bacterium]
MGKKHWLKLSIKYITAGASATLVHVLVVFLLFDVFNWTIFISTSLAFVLAFSVSFSLQKFWTFRNLKKKYLTQLLAYFVLNLFNFFINGFLMVVFVEYWGIFYLLSQIIVSLIIAVNSFLVYKFVIFKP